MNKRNTYQKKLIYEAVANSCNHPTAEEVYETVSKSCNNISRTTVYRNLNNLAALNKIRKIECPNESDRFDKTLEKHYHLKCSHCGRFIDVSLNYHKDMDISVYKQTGFYDIEHDIIFRGLCPECRNLKYKFDPGNL